MNAEPSSTVIGWLLVCVSTAMVIVFALIAAFARTTWRDGVRLILGPLGLAMVGMGVVEYHERQYLGAFAYLFAIILCTMGLRHTRRVLGRMKERLDGR
jgi:hypothetical protein